MITLNIEKQGESITFFSETDPSAPRAEVEVRLAPGASGPPPHIHTRQSETFHVVSGRLIVTVDGKDHTLEAGETLVVQAGQAHTFANASETEPLIGRGEVEPALYFQWMLTEMSKSAIRAGGGWKDMSPLEAAYILYQMRDEYRLAGIPFVLQDIILGVLARAAVILGRTKDIVPRDVFTRNGTPVG